MGRISTIVFALCVGLILFSSSFMVVGVQDVPDGILSEGPVDIVQTAIEEIKPDTYINTGLTVYHSWDETVAEMQQTAIDHPGITKLISIGQSWEGRDIWAMKISDNPDIEEPDEPEVYFNGDHHAREWLTIEINLFIIRALTDNYSTNSTITNIVDNRQIWVIPIVNPDGRVYDSAGDDPAVHARPASMGWRKNKRDNNGGGFNENDDGVDLNRNYGYMWGASGASGAPNEDTYAGPSGFSEPESQAVRDWARQHDFVFAVSWHTYSQLILYPWGWTYEPAPDDLILAALAQEMSNRMTNKAGSAYPGYTPQQSSDLYPTAGSDDDWLYGELGSYAFTIEGYPHPDDRWIQGDPAVSDPYDLFHPREDKVVPVSEDNLPAAIFLMQIADNPNQVIDHVEITAADPDMEISKGASNLTTVDILNDGQRDDDFTLTTSTIPGWTIDITPAWHNILRNQTKQSTVDITVPGGAVPGTYTIWVNATSDSNPGSNDSSTITVVVPYDTDVSSQSITPFQEFGVYPIGGYWIDGLVRNSGETVVPVFDSTLTITRFGPDSPVSLFSDDMESGSGNWQVIDWDGLLSSSEWNIDNFGRASASSWWSGTPGGGGYQDNTNTMLEMVQTVDLREASSATLSYWTYYNIENNWDFCVVQGSGDGGQTWEILARYTGNAQSWTQHNIDLSNFTGARDFKVRFWFTSDGGVTSSGIWIDDIDISMMKPSENIVFGPAPLSTSGNLAAGSTESLSWFYDFTQGGRYRATLETTFAGDQYASNDITDVIFDIDPSLYMSSRSLSVGWNLISVPLNAQDNSLQAVLSSIDGKYSLCQYYNASDPLDPWKSFIPSAGNSELQQIGNNMGLWIYLTEAGVLNVSGVMPVTTNISLAPGWNLVGYPSTTPLMADATLPVEVTKIAIFDNGQAYNINEVPLSGVTMSEGNAYWVYATSATTWSVDW